MVYVTTNIRELLRLRRLDVLFAEKVLGRKVAWDVAWLPNSERDPSNAYFTDDVTCPLVPRYTRSLDAAWTGLLPRFHFIQVSQVAEMSALAEVELHEPAFEVTKVAAAHPAEALVMACLRAVGVREEEIDA